jgi:hypothetical protein
MAQCQYLGRHGSHAEAVRTREKRVALISTALFCRYTWSIELICYWIFHANTASKAVCVHRGFYVSRHRSRSRSHLVAMMLSLSVRKSSKHVITKEGLEKDWHDAKKSEFQALIHGEGHGTESHEHPPPAGRVSLLFSREVGQGTIALDARNHRVHSLIEWPLLSASHAATTDSNDVKCYVFFDSEKWEHWHLMQKDWFEYFCITEPDLLLSEEESRVLADLKGTRFTCGYLQAKSAAASHQGEEANVEPSATTNEPDQSLSSLKMMAVATHLPGSKARKFEDRQRNVNVMLRAFIAFADARDAYVVAAGDFNTEKEEVMRAMEGLNERRRKQVQVCATCPHSFFSVGIVSQHTTWCHLGVNASL